MVSYPQEVIPTFDMAVNEMFFERYPAAVLKYQIQVRPFNAQKTKNMRSLNPEGKMIMSCFHKELTGLLALSTFLKLFYFCFSESNVG